MEEFESTVTALRARLGDCTPAERKVARVLLAGLPAVGFETVAAIAERAGVSGPTVLRLLARLGFRGLPDFQQALRRELDDRQASPLVLYDARADAPEGPVVFAEAVRRTLDGLPRADVDRVVALLADRRRRPLLVGGRFSRLLAAYLQVRAQGGAVVLVTDRWLSPIAGTADAVLSCEVDAPSAYDSLVPAMAVVETVVAGVLAARGDEARARMAACEQVARAADLLD